jgi:peroxiredoxin
MKVRFLIAAGFFFVAATGVARADSLVFEKHIYDPGPQKPIDSQLKVKNGQPAPDFNLPAIDGQRVRLSDYQGRNVLISFVPAAWTPVCSDQWPGYQLAEGLFKSHNTVLIGISTDNVPSLWAWTRQMGALWFPVLSDFWPHGAVAGEYGLLRTDGTAERALIFIDTKGIIRHIHISDINQRPKLDLIAEQLARLHPIP